MSDKLRLGVSACLLGRPVRYNGGHKLDHFLVDMLGPHVDFVPVCPEVECGLGVPRESLRLVGDPEAPRLVTTRTKRDMTDRMLEWARWRVDELAGDDLCGFVFKSRSPSSGMTRIKVYNEKGVPAPVGVGMFAREFMRRFPLLPVEDDGRLHDPGIRENFIERIFALRRWHDVARQAPSRGALVAFHTAHKLLILSHGQHFYRTMGKLVAEAKTIAPDRLFAQYETMLMDALRVRATVANHVNTMQHIAGHFKKDLSADEKQELGEVIAAYRAGHVPLIVPMTLLNHYVRKYNKAYLTDQFYLRPHPLELRLRNHA